MQTNNPIFDEMAKLATGAMSLAQAASDEARAAFTAQMDRIIVEFDLVRREDLEALNQKIKVLEEKLDLLLEQKDKPQEEKID